MADEDVLVTAAAVRRGVTRLGRRLHLERSERSEPLLQLGLLAHLNRRGPLTPGELAAVERVQPQSLTRALASLTADGLITRQVHPEDARRSLLAITDTGLETLRADMRQRDGWLAGVLTTHLTSTERGLLQLAGELLDRLAEVDSPAGGEG
ncbi:MAG TPA: MarR family transcriptional regulator [Pseudonocardiaceae bacterium]|jgi:DNA-binding MarR family transcriptional regulator|nr:MarR family transcriptional regulator [Pseudonocardiaceae bacterium]